MASREGHTSMGGGTSSPGRIGITQLTVYLMQQSLRLTSSHRYSHIYLYPPFRLKKALRYSRQVSPLKQYRTKRADEEKSKPKAKMLVCGKKRERKKPRQTVVCQYVLRQNISKIVVKPNTIVHASCRIYKNQGVHDPTTCHRHCTAECDVKLVTGRTAHRV